MRRLALAIALALIVAGCPAVRQQTVALKCVDRPANQLLPGEVQFDSMTVIDASTSKIPLIVSPHRLVAICGGEEGPASWGMETPVEGGFEEFTDPIKAGITHFSYGF